MDYERAVEELSQCIVKDWESTSGEGLYEQLGVWASRE